MGKQFDEIKLEIRAQLDSATGGTWGTEIDTQFNKAAKKVAQDLPDCLLGELMMGTIGHVANLFVDPTNKILECTRPDADLRVVSLRHYVQTTGKYKSVKRVPAYGDVLAAAELAGTKWVSGRATTLAALEGGLIKVGPVAKADVVQERYVLRPTDLVADADETQLPDDLVDLAEDYACYLALLQTRGENAKLAITYLNAYRNGVVDRYQKAGLEPPLAYVNRPENK